MGKSVGPFVASGINGDVFPAQDVSNYTEAEVQLTGTWVGTVTFQGSNDNVNYVSVQARAIGDTTQAPVTSTTGNGLFRVALGFKFFRARMTAYTSGSATGQTEVNHISGDQVPTGVTIAGTPAVTLSGTGNSVQGTVAHDSAAAQNPVQVGYNARTTNVTAVSDNDVCRPICDLNGRQIVIEGGPQQLQDMNRTVLTTTTETTHIAAVASVRHHIGSMIVANLSAANSVQVDVRDTTAGTIRMTFNLAANQSIAFDPRSWAQAAVNTNWTVQATGTTPNVAISSRSWRSNF